MNTSQAAQPAGNIPDASRKMTQLFGDRRQVRLAGCILILSLFSYFLISHYVLMAVEIKGTSMSPTLIDGQRYLLYRCTYLWRAPQRSEIVVIRDPQDHGLSIKRIVALPNDLVQMKRDGLYINGVKVPEPYLISKYTMLARNEPTKPVRLSNGQYFVLGDNRDGSADSRIYGPVPRDQVPRDDCPLISRQLTNQP